MKPYLLIFLLLLSGCSWVQSKWHTKASPPPLPELIVTGAPLGGVLFVDGVKMGPPKEPGDHPQVVDVAPGPHVVEVKVEDAVVYRENTEVAAGDKRVITVLSGSNRY